MIVVGLTGGIGSGKTTVAKLFEDFGVPVYIADIEAKKLMNQSKVIKRKLIQLFGEEAYKGGVLNRPFLADAIFNNEVFLEKMNSIIHPRVARHFEKWIAKQNVPYVIKEVAILFENGGYKVCDYVITVTAPKETRIKRLLKRDHTSVARIEAIMRNQWTDEARIERSDFVIENINLEKTKEKVAQIHKEIITNIKF
ncbi:dephospho-CoA kinase [Tamlana fucoidanivorans]|uniref:Dephospho-CoA kinase n=1 Tax=Allotamlana fucoidanivorans TaxID=2583814 RepID=A0A5C4SHR5_9FLAO|nr:dephospho-CoA kinase [Tamlana fucoidanivorans]TNJ43093.1 dephospho-CoA kinase [Tamlana fucoidanivorans]